MRTGVALPINHQRFGYVFKGATLEQGRTLENEYASLRFSLQTQCRNCAIQNSAQKTGHISTSRLNTLLCLHLKPINLIIFNVSHNDFLSWRGLPAYMLSAVIPSRHSYPAMPLARQLVDQRSVLFGPLVLETNLLKNQRP